jgi:hypothetical protein
MHAEIAVSRFQQTLELGKGQSFAHSKNADDAQAHALVNYRI